jgi:hypothetical protein
MIKMFDQRAHDLLVNLLDVAEEQLIEYGICGPQETNEYLTAFYIEEASCFLRHGLRYLPSEGRIAGDLFIWKLANATNSPKYHKHAKACGKQLAEHTELYFPRYAEMLTKAYIETLQNVEEPNLIMTHGVILLAAATLPGVDVALRREFRRRGLTYDRSLICDDDLATRRRVGLAPKDFDMNALSCPTAGR